MDQDRDQDLDVSTVFTLVSTPKMDSLKQPFEQLTRMSLSALRAKRRRNDSGLGSIFNSTLDYTSSCLSPSSTFDISSAFENDVDISPPVIKKCPVVPNEPSNTSSYSPKSEPKSTETETKTVGTIAKKLQMKVSPKTNSKTKKLKAKAAKQKATNPLASTESSFLSSSRSIQWPCITDMNECVKRNKVLRDYITGHSWYASKEFHLLRTLIVAPCRIKGWKRYLYEYNLLYDTEWKTIGGSGQGDLLCTDGHNRFLVVELKVLRSGTGTSKSRQAMRQKKRKYGESQAARYAEAWHQGNPQVKQTIGILVTDRGVREVMELRRSDGSEHLTELANIVS